MSGMQRSFTGEALSGGPVSWTTPITGPDPAKQFQIGVQCNNIPTDGQVAFTVASPGPPVPPVSLPKTQITAPNVQITMGVGDWPAGAESTITVDYWPGATPPPAGSSITVILYVAANS